MPDATKREDVQPGTVVKVVEKYNQRTGILTEGVVKEVLTGSSTHPYGIKVLLENGVVGRVKEIMKSTSLQYGESLHQSSGTTIPKNEDQVTEFKATFRFDMNRFQHTGSRTNSKELEKSISKTVAAFMNASGGSLYIGIGDDTNVIGLADDYASLEKPNSDRFRLKLKSSLQGYLRDKIIFDLINIEFPCIEDKEICKLIITPSPTPIFLHDEGKQECYVRVDNESKPYDYKEFMEYWQRHSTK